MTPVIVPLDGGVRLQGGPDVMVLSTPVPVTVADGRATARFTLAAGESVCFGLHHRSSDEPGPRLWSQDDLQRRLDGTIATWRSWAGCTNAYEGPWRHLVHHSGRVLQALTFRRPARSPRRRPRRCRSRSAASATGTTGTRGCATPRSRSTRCGWRRAPTRRDAFFDLHGRRLRPRSNDGGDLQIMFGVGGEHDLTERELPTSPGWRDSRPVRVGNGAWDQRQLDVYGELLNAAARLPEVVER